MGSFVTTNIDRHPWTLNGSQLGLLVVDDEPYIRTILRTALEAQGCAVAEAASGKRIVAHAKKHQPDIILLDIMMPGVDGYAALAALQRGKRTRDIPMRC